MKNVNLINSIIAGLIIIAAFMKILHLPYADGVLNFLLIGGLFLQSQIVIRLERRIKELEQTS